MIKPIGHWMHVKRVEESDNKSQGGIILTGDGKRNQSYKVLAVGDEVTIVNVGNEVVTTQFAENIMSVHGQDVMLLEDKNVLAVVVDDVEKSI